LLAHALTVDPMCVRASLTLGRLAQDAGDYDRALQAYSRIDAQDPEYLVEVLPAMLACYQALKREDEFKECLARLAHRRYGTVPTLVLADLMAAQQGSATAIRYLNEQLVQQPSLHGVHRLIQYMLKDEPTAGHRELESLLDITQKMLRDNKAYKCRHCGYASKALHWQCPGCKHWATVKPGHDHHHD
jgi:lipopolysaccharide biosynthesis regulator YciM